MEEKRSFVVRKTYDIIIKNGDNIVIRKQMSSISPANALMNVIRKNQSSIDKLVSFSAQINISVDDGKE